MPLSHLNLLKNVFLIIQFKCSEKTGRDVIEDDELR